jgi:hypothetical protein
MAGGVYARVVAVAVAAGAAVLGFPPCRARPRPSSCGPASRPRRPSMRHYRIPYSSSQAATPSQELPARPIRRCHAGPDRQGRHQADRPDAGRRQAGCRPVDAAPLKCAVCGTIVSWPNRKAAASQTCPVRWPISRPLDARTGRSAPLAHDEPGIDRPRVFGDLKLFEPKTRCRFIAVRDCGERSPGLVWPWGSRSM